MKTKYIVFTVLLLAVFSCKQEKLKEKSSIENDLTISNKKSRKTASQILEALKDPSEKDVLVIAHRGDWRYAPENSLESIKRCIDIGVDIVEVDFRLTKDGHLIAMHDKTVNRTTNGNGKVSDLTLEEIKQLRLKSNCGVPGSRQQVPTLNEVMLLVKDKIMVNLDKTEGKTIREAYEVLKKTGTVNHAIFKGNDSFEIMYNKYGSLMDSIIYMPKLWYKNKNLSSYVESFEKEINPFMYEILFDSENAETFKMIPNIIKRNDKFLAIALWDELVAGHTDEQALIESPDAAWGWLIEQGANAIMTDRPEELIEYLKEKKMHN